MLSRTQIKKAAYDIAAEFGGLLTVRQLYYQFVARGLMPSGQKVYRRVVGAISDARLEGSFPWTWIVDRTREARASEANYHAIHVPKALEEVADAIRQAPNWALGSARWWNQPCYVTVGVEKEALAGVFEEPCRELGVGLFVFRGYSSLSALWQLCRHLEQAQEISPHGLDEAVLLYFGDHDPDGWEIPRSAERNIHQIARTCNMDIPPLRLERVALNMAQIARYDPPPFGAKMTSSRYQGYIDEHDTDDAWELDALRPDVLQRLIRDAVNAEFDPDIRAENADDVGSARLELMRQMKTAGWIASVLDE